MKMKFLFIYLLFFIGLFAYAQEDVTVLVINYKTNQPVGNVSVKLNNDSRGFEAVQQTNADGKAVFYGVQINNNYQVTIDAFGEFTESVSEIFDLRSNQDRTIQIFLLPAIASEVTLNEIVLTGNTSAKINRKDAEVSFELTNKEIQELPIEGRDITRVLFRLPNVSQATGFFSEAPNVSINGANSLFTSYLIDGMDNNERFLGGQRFAIPVGFTRNITVLTNNYSAEFGLTNNGVINITTKSGSNELTGEVFFVTRPGPDIDGKSKFAQRDLSGNQVKDGFQRYQQGFAIGGPIVKDKTFFFVNVEHTIDKKDNLLTSPDLGVNESVRGENTFTYYSAKIDHQWSSRLRSSLRANVGEVTIERQGGGLEGGTQFPSAGNFQDRNSINIALKNDYTGDWFSSQTNLQYSHFRWNFGRPENPNDPQVTVLNPSEETIAVLGHPGFVFDATENTYQLQQKFKFYTKKHTFKTGFGFISGDHSLLGGGNVNGNWRVKLNQSQMDQLAASGLGSDLNFDDLPSDAEVINFDVELREASFGKTQNIVSFYMEDEYAFNERLNLTFGLRYDYDNLSKGGSDDGDYNNISPRFNFNYKLDNRSTIRGGYGIFYDKINYAIYSDALQQNTNTADYRLQLQEFIDLGILPAGTDLDKITFNGNLSASLQNVDYLNAPPTESLQAQRETVFSNERRILNPNGYKNPYTHQFALGYQLQVDKNKLFFVDLVHNQSFKMFRLRNLNAPAPFPVDPNNVQIRTVTEADQTRPIPIVNNSANINGQTVTGVARNVVMTETEGSSRYYAMSLNLQKDRGEDDYGYRINYTLSSLENNTEDINFKASDGNNFGNEWGPSINDRTHIINAIFNYYPVDNLTLTLAGLIQSGQPINRTPDAAEFGTADLNGDGSSFGDAFVGNSDRYPGENRNNDRLPWSNTFDVSVLYNLNFLSNKLEFSANIFNVFNAQNLSGFSNNATQSNQIQTGSRSSGRIVQKNAGPPRQFQFGLRYLF